MFERLAVVGTGAIGSIVGAYLTRAGHPITLIDPWSAHVETMQRDGLTVTSQDEEFTVPVDAVHLGDANKINEPFDAVFLSVKSYDTVWATHMIRDYLLKPTGVIISAQNSINDELIAPIIGYTRDIGCIVTLGAGIYEPAHVLHTSVPSRMAFTFGELSGMDTPRVEALAALMNDALPSRTTANIWGERWAKLVTNCMANSVCSLTGIGSAAVRQTPTVTEVSIRIASEVVKVGRALGVAVEAVSGIDAEVFERADDAQVLEDIKTQLAEGAGQLGEGRPSMFQDVMKGRKTEIDYLNGYTAGRGAQIGVGANANAAIVPLIKQIEKGEIQPDLSNIKYLEQFA